MAFDKAHVEVLYPEYQSHYAKSKSFLDSGDEEGVHYAASHPDHCQFLAVAEYILFENVDAFRSYLLEGSKCTIRLLRRYDEGEEQLKEYVSMATTEQLLDCLASQDWETTLKFAHLLGGREGAEEDDSPFMIHLGYCLKWLITGDRVKLESSMEALAKEASGSDFIGYSTLVRAIASNEERLFSEGLNQVLMGHLRQCRHGELLGTVHEVLCLWGVAMVLLAEQLGMDTSRLRYSHLIPAPLAQRQ